MSSIPILPINEVPQALRPISHFVKIANDYASRDIVIYYWCLLKAVEDAMKIDSNSQDSKKFIVTMMNILEQVKQQNKDNEAIMQDLVAQSHIEDQALRLFKYADSQDSSGQFNQKMMKAFYTCGYLFDVLSIFGTLDDSIQSARKFAKWRAAYIAGCIKRGEQPVPGNQMAKSDDGGQTGDITSQINELSADLNALNASIGQPPPKQQQQPQSKDYGHGFFSLSHGEESTRPSAYPDVGFGQMSISQQPSHATHFGGGLKPGLQEPPYEQPPNSSPSAAYNSPTNKYRTQIQWTNQIVGQQLPKPSSTAEIAIQPATTQNLKLEDYLEAKKYTKFASSALDYEDPKTAIDYLQKAIAVLQKPQ